MKKKIYLQTPGTIHKRWRIVGIIILVICLGATYGFWTFIELSNDQFSGERLSNSADNVIDVLESRLEVSSDVLYGGRALFLLNPQLTREQWDVYMESQNFFERYPGLNTIAYLQKADIAEADEITAQLNALRTPEETAPISLTPQPLTDPMAIITYTTRLTDFQVTGVNAYGRDYLVPALLRAEAAGVPVASPPYPSRNPARQGTMDFVVFLPIYDSTYRPTMTTEQKRQRVTGYVAASLHPETLIKEGLKTLQAGTKISITAKTPSDMLIYKTDYQPTANYIEKTTTIDVGGQTWNVTFRASDQFGLTTREILAPTFMLVGGLVFMIMFVSLYFYRTGIRLKRLARLDQRNQDN